MVKRQNLLRLDDDPCAPFPIYCVFDQMEYDSGIVLSLKLFRTCAGHKDSVSSLAFSTDGQFLASGSFDGVVQIWETKSGNLKCTLDGPGGGIEVRI